MLHVITIKKNTDEVKTKAKKQTGKDSICMRSSAEVPEAFFRLLLGLSLIMWTLPRNFSSTDHAHQTTFIHKLFVYLLLPLSVLRRCP